MKNRIEPIAMMYHDYHFLGIHLIWWFIWCVLMFWLFASPYRFFGQKKTNESLLDTLKKKYASGEMTTHEYEERKKILTSKA